MAVTALRKPKSAEEILEQIKSNSRSLIKAVEHFDEKEIGRLLQELRSLEDDIYNKITHDHELPYNKKVVLREQLAKIQHILLAEKADLKTKHLRDLKKLAGKEELIAEEAEKKIKSAEKKHGWEALFDMLQTGDIIGNSVTDYTPLWGKAAYVFMKATNSKICHVGIIDVRESITGRKIFVIEAGDTIKATPIKDFIAHHFGKIAVYRYKHRLTDEQKKVIIGKARSWTKSRWQFWKKPLKYDYALAPGEAELYCSELVDEAYKAGGIRLVSASTYYSVSEFSKRVEETFMRRFYTKLGIKSFEEALGMVIGKKGFYYRLDPEKVNQSRETVITPGDIIKNSNTVKIFDNIPPVP